MSIRPIKRVVQATPTIEGAGVKLRRAFGFGNTGDFDPFLLFDDFRNERPEDYPSRREPNRSAPPTPRCRSRRATAPSCCSTAATR